MPKRTDVGFPKRAVANQVLLRAELGDLHGRDDSTSLRMDAADRATLGERWEWREDAFRRLTLAWWDGSDEGPARTWHVLVKPWRKKARWAGVTRVPRHMPGGISVGLVSRGNEAGHDERDAVYVATWLLEPEVRFGRVLRTSADTVQLPDLRAHYPGVGRRRAVRRLGALQDAFFMYVLWGDEHGAPWGWENVVSLGESESLGPPSRPAEGVDLIWVPMAQSLIREACAEELAL